MRLPPWIRIVPRARIEHDDDRHPHEWYRERVRPGDGLPLADARRDYMDWLFSRNIDHKTSQRDAGKRLLRAMGYRTTRRDGVTAFRDVALAAICEECGNDEVTEGLTVCLDCAERREQIEDSGPFEVLTALGRFRAAGLIGADAAKVAWEEYNGSDTGTDDD